MINRRHFLWLTGLAATSTPALALSSLDPQRPAPPTPAGPLPPSIAALKSLKDEAKPITRDERRHRIERARALMADNHIDALMLAAGTSLQYFSGMRWGNSERMFAMLLPAKGEAFYVCPAFEEERARELISQGPLGESADVRTWQEDQSPSERVAQGLKDRGIAAGRLGVEETVPFVFSNAVAAAAPALKIVSGTPISAGCRMSKDDHELALMRLAARVTLAAYKAAHAALHEGMTQNEFAELVRIAHARQGFQGEAGVQVGKYSALPHGSRTPQVIRSGEVLLMDGGCNVEGYSSDISRTFVLGKASDKMKHVFEVEQRAQNAALAAARPGVECQAVDAAARKVITEAGFGPDYKYFTHRVGHGMGMDGHEWPYLVRGNTLPLAANMVFSDEPGIYIRGEFGVRLEDDMVITADGAQLMTPPSPSIEDPFANA